MWIAWSAKKQLSVKVLSAAIFKRERKTLTLSLTVSVWVKNRENGNRKRVRERKREWSRVLLLLKTERHSFQAFNVWGQRFFLLKWMQKLLLRQADNKIKLKVSRLLLSKHMTKQYSRHFQLSNLLNLFLDRECSLLYK